MATFKIFFGQSTEEAGAQIVTATLADSLLFAESSGRTISTLRTLTDSFLYSDQLNVMAKVARIISESFTLMDQLQNIESYSRDIKDALPFSELSNKIVFAIRSILDTAGFVEVWDRLVDLRRSVHDSSVFLDQQNQSFVFARQIVEPFLLKDLSNAELTSGEISRLVKELVLLMDSFDRTYTGQRERQEAPGLTDVFLVSVFRPIEFSPILPSRLAVRDYLGVSTKVKNYLGVVLGVRGPLYG